jgi:hypothetical protein
MAAGGAGLRTQLAQASRQAVRESGNEGVAAALAALSAGKMQWLGAAHQRGVPVRIRVSGAGMQVLSSHAVAAKAALRKLGGDWHMVLYNVQSGTAQHPSSISTAPTPETPVTNSFADLAVDAGAEQTVTPPASHIVADLSGAVVCKGDRYGVAVRKPAAEPPYEYAVTYTSGVADVMGAAEALARMVVTWTAVPASLKRRLQQLGGRMRQPVSAAAQAAADASAVHPASDAAFDGIIIKKRFTAGTYYAVVTLLQPGHPARAGRFIYQATYTDHDTETLMASTVERLAVKAWTRIPQSLHAALRAMGGEVYNGLVSGATTSPHATQQATVQLAQGEAGVQGGSRAASQRTAQQQQGRAQARRRRRQAAGRVRSANQALQQQGLKVGFINVCGMTQVKAGELTEAVHSLGVDILGVAETWEGKCKAGNIPGYTYIGKPRRAGMGGGVGFFINTVLEPLITPHINTQLPEALWLEVANRQHADQPTFIGLVYIPPSSLTTAQLVQTTYQQLQADIQAFQLRGNTVVIGDFNSRVGTADACGQHVGQLGEVVVDAAGRSMVAMLQATNMFSMNGRTVHPDAHGSHIPQYTRVRQVTHNDTITEQCAVLDYVLAPAQWALPASDQPHACKLHIESKWTPQGADHLLMWMAIPLRTTRQDTPLHTRCRPNIHLLTTPSDALQDHRDAYAAAIATTCEGYEEWVQELQAQVSAGTITAAEAVSQAKDDLIGRVHNAITASIGYKTPRGRGRTTQHSPLYTREVRAAVKQRRVAEQNMQTARTHNTTNPSAEALTALQHAQTAYTTASRNVKTVVGEARKSQQATHIHAVVQDMEAGNSRGMWQGLRRLAGQRTQGGGPQMLQDTQGVLTMGAQQMADILAAQYETTTNAQKFAQHAGFDDQHKQQVEDSVAAYRAEHEEGPQGLACDISVDEVETHCRSLHNSKSPSPLDDINNELLKYGADAMYHALTSLYSLQFSTEHKAQTPGIIIPLYKKDDPTLAVNYRPITLGSTIDKLYNTILNSRICQHLESSNGLHDAQHGFRAGRSAIDNIFMLTQVINARKHSKQDTYMLFLDIEKAYDSVWRAGLLYHLWSKGVTGKMFRVLAQMTDQPHSMVFHKGTYSSAFQPGMGWEQGDTLATTMFNVHIDAVLQHVWAEHAGVPIPGTGEGFGKMVALMYADDLGAVANSAEDLTSLIASVRTALTRWRLKASVKPGDGSKTAIMVIKGTRQARRTATEQPAHAWFWGDVEIPQVTSYRYLGAVLAATGKWDEHITKRMQKATSAAAAQHKVMSQSKLPWHLRHLTLTSVVQPVLTYACQVWGRTTKALRDQLDTWQFACVKRMFHLPTTTAHACIQQELGITPLHVACDMWTLCYWHHLRRLTTDRLLQQVFTAWTGSANPWQQNINKLITEYHIDTAATCAYSRGKFKNYVKSCAMTQLEQEWSAACSRQQDGIVHRYSQAFGFANIITGINGTHPVARQYVSRFTHQGRGPAAEVCMQLRTESLPLRCIRSKARRGETHVAQAARELCPLCKAAAETPSHFLLHCPAYHTARERMMLHLTITSPQTVAALHTDSQWRYLLTDDVIGVSPCAAIPAGGEEHGTLGARPTTAAAETAKAVLDFLITAWKLRSTALNGRETNGGDAMV